MSFSPEDQSKLEAYCEQYNADMKLAGQVHRSLIPANQRRGNLEVFCEYIPMLGVGGDYGSVFYQDNHHVVATVCDVSGHGIAAALLAGRVNSFVLNKAPTVDHPCEIVKGLNSFIYKNFSHTDLFLTFFCIFIDFKKHILVRSGCGHPPILLYQKKTDQVLRLESDNALLGAFENLSLSCEMESIPFENGDRILLYTDGITEAQNPNGEMFKVDRLENLYKKTLQPSLSEHVRSIMDKLNQFRQGVPPGDDQLMLALSHID